MHLRARVEFSTCAECYAVPLWVPVRNAMPFPYGRTQHTTADRAQNASNRWWHQTAHRGHQKVHRGSNNLTSMPASSKGRMQERGHARQVVRMTLLTCQVLSSAIAPHYVNSTRQVRHGMVWYKALLGWNEMDIDLFSYLSLINTGACFERTRTSA